MWIALNPSSLIVKASFMSFSLGGIQMPSLNMTTTVTTTFGARPV